MKTGNWSKTQHASNIAFTFEPNPLFGHDMKASAAIDSYWVRTALFTTLLALIGFSVFPWVGLASLTAQQAFTAGIVVSGLVLPALLLMHQKPQPTQAPELALTTLYVGNLPYRANEASVRQLFSQHGRVFSVRLMKDRETGRRRGFGFIEMTSDEAAKAIAALNESIFQERTLKVREANQRKATNAPSRESESTPAGELQ